MGKEILKFGDIEIEKNKFYNHKSSIFYKDVDIEKVLLSNKISPSEKNYKYFIGYLFNDHKVKSLHILLPKTSVCKLIEDSDLLEKYNTIWHKVIADIRKGFDSEPVYNKNQNKILWL